MRKFTALLTSLLLLGIVFPTFSQVKVPGFNDDAAIKAANSDQKKGITLSKQVNMSEELQPSSIQIKKGKAERLPIHQKNKIRMTSEKSFVSMNDLKEDNIQLDYAADNSVERTSAVKLIKENETTLKIENFWGGGGTITAQVDYSKGEIVIEPQLMYENATYGPCFIYSVNLDKKIYDTKAKIYGTIDENGITLESWGCVIASGDYTGSSFGLYRGSSIKASNATMKNIALDKDSVPYAMDVPVLVEQNSKNMVRVYNFAGINSKINIQIKNDKSLVISPQYLFNNASYGNFYFYPADWTKGVFYSRPINGSTTDTNMSWGNWIIATNKGVFAYRFLSTSIDLPFTLSYPPTQTQEGFKGTGTETDPYLIENAADLLALSQIVNNDTLISGRKYSSTYVGKFFKQTANIDMKEYSFPPIGGSDDVRRFGGTYDGNSKKISNLTIDAGGAGYCGLFGCIDTTGIVKNITITNANLKSSYYYAGSVVAYSLGTIENCHADGTVYGLFCVGGVAGYSRQANNASFQGSVTGDGQTGGVIGVTYSKVSNLWSDATVTCISTTSTAGAGGVVGYVGNRDGGAVSDCYFNGSLYILNPGVFGGSVVGVAVCSPVTRCFSIGKVYATGTQSAAGGIVGAAQGGTITDSYFAGSIEYSIPWSGGILGYCIDGLLDGQPVYNSISNCYISGIVRSTSTMEYAPYIGNYPKGNTTFTNCFFDQKIMPNTPKNIGAMNTEDMIKATAWEGFDTEIWNFTDRLYPRLKGIDTNKLAYVSAAPMYLVENDNTMNISNDFTVSTANSVSWKAMTNGALSTTGNGIEISGANIHLNGTFAVDTLVASIGNYSKYYVITCTPQGLYEGKGTEESPYLIKNKEDLITLAKATTVDLMSYSGSYFQMTNDIDLEYDETFTGISATDKATYCFGGIFDGNGYTIHRCKLVFVTLDQDNKIANKTSYRGFIGRLSERGTIKNLTMATDCEFKFGSYSSPFVGYNYGGVIENCKNYADVYGYVGNVAGMTSYNKEGGIIRNCYNAGKIITGQQNAGGITAFNRGTIENCQNVGEIGAEVLSATYTYDKLKVVAGISHSNFGTIKNVLNTGYVHAPTQVGGIVGFYNSDGSIPIAESAINLGRLSCDDDMVGNAVGKLYKEGTFNHVYYDKQTYLSSAAQDEEHEGVTPMSTASLTSGTALEGLDPEIWLFEEGKYPVLKAFAEETGAKAAAISVIHFPEEEKCNTIKSDLTLGANAKLTWTLKTGSSFLIENNMLCLNPNTDLKDTLIATYETFVKRIPIVAKPDTLPAPVITMNTTTNGDEWYFIDCDYPDVQIYYTLNSDTPSKDATLYEGEFQVTQDCTIKAYATKRSCYDSSVTEYEATANGITDINAGKAILSRKYVTPSGITSTTPVSGINIMITVYEDGTTERCKMIAK